jgi:hypothetical protein
VSVWCRRLFDSTDRSRAVRSPKPERSHPTYNIPGASLRVAEDARSVPPREALLHQIPLSVTSAAASRNQRQRFSPGFARSFAVAFATDCHRLRPLGSIEAPYARRRLAPAPRLARRHPLSSGSSARTWLTSAASSCPKSIDIVTADHVVREDLLARPRIALVIPNEPVWRSSAPEPRAVRRRG